MIHGIVMCAVVGIRSAAKTAVLPADSIRRSDGAACGRRCATR